MKGLVPIVALLLATAACGDLLTGSKAGELQVTIEGLPSDVSAAVAVTGPGGFSRTLTQSEALTDLKPATYVVRATAVTSDAAQFAPLRDSIEVQVGSGIAEAEVRYVDLRSSLRIRIQGLPQGATGEVSVSGPGGFQQTTREDRLLPGLAPGVYEVTAAGVASGDSTYQWRPVSQSVTVRADQPNEVQVAYTSVGPRALNLRVERAYLVQVVQNSFGTVPMIEGRDAMLRVFAKGDQANTAAPRVRARLYLDGSLRSTLVAGAGQPGVPLSFTQGNLLSSWNFPIPADLVRPGLSVQVELDPDNAVVELDESDNTFPSSGAPQPVAVESVPPFLIRFVPVRQTATGLVGEVGDPHALLATTRKLFPIHQYDADVRAVYTSDSPALDPSNDNGSWSKLISEVDALRVAEGTSRYYYGVVKLPYQGGIVGIGQIPGKAALGYDRMPNAAEVVAHELGHDWGRRHTRCGGAGGADPEYPYDQGQIGVFGLDLATGKIKSPTATDIMGYCDDVWISDYTFNGVLEHRRNEAQQAAAATQPSLLLWGRIRDGEVFLEPAFEISAGSALPRESGPHRIEGVGARGEVLFSVGFAGDPVADLPGERTFAFAVPMSPVVRDRLVGLRISGPRGTVIRSGTASTSVGPRGLPEEPDVAAERVSSREVVLRWTAAESPVVMVRNPDNGQILSFGRGGDVRLPNVASVLEVHVSDGVRSRSRLVAVQER